MRIVLFGLLIVVMLAVIALLLGPREPVEGAIEFEAKSVGGDLDAYLAERESLIENIRPGAEKRIVWADPATRARTPLAIIYVHGFSASSEEIRPVPELVAGELDANLMFMRLRGHGRDSEAMRDGSAPAWMDDVAEAMEIGRQMGDRVILIGTSMGASLGVLSVFNRGLSKDLAGIVQISPNYGVNSILAPLLALGYARKFVPIIAGQERSFTPVSVAHRKAWTSRYPTEALVPMSAVARAAAGLNFEATRLPSLFLFSEQDKVLDISKIWDVANRWGGPVEVLTVDMGPGDDPSAHVIAGDILSPGLTGYVVEAIVEWARRL